ncbi:tetratricopeptide repeat protein [Roseimaritima sediminicola]|uniref:tetratricopeptide repeat protein n=1 Tax=Roseimaritima sediminicola TaxID=2662066 RepID=UPI00129843D7|nr:tetratricopeptide repeat protein [Roseimaritima sediminicola]
MAWSALSEAEHQLLLRNHDQMLRRLETASRLNGDPAEIAWFRARLARRYGDGHAMQRHLREALAAGLERERAEREALLAEAQNGQLEAVDRELARWMKNPGSHAADIADVYVLGLRAQGRLAEAKLIVQTWVADCPWDPKAYLAKGQIAEAEFRKEDTQKAYRQAVETNPSYPPGLFALGQWLVLQQRPDEALPLLDRCVASDALAAPAVNPFRARCHRLLGAPEQAEAVLQSALAAAPRDLEKAYLRLCLKPQSGLAEYERGMLDFDAGHFAEAAERFRQSLQLAPQLEDAEYQLGLTLKRLGQADEGDEILTRVTERRARFAELGAYAYRIADEPDNVDARFRMGVLMLENGRHAGGLFHLKCVLALEPGHVAAHQTLAQFYEQHQNAEPNYAARARTHREILETLQTSQP